MRNIEIPPSAPVTKEEREKWLEKAEYGGKTRRLIDHIERLESEFEKAKCLIIPFLQCRIEQAEAERDAGLKREEMYLEKLTLAENDADRAEAERDALARHMQNICHPYCPVDSCGKGENDCSTLILEWARNEAGRE